MLARKKKLMQEFVLSHILDTKGSIKMLPLTIHKVTDSQSFQYFKQLFLGYSVFPPPAEMLHKVAFTCQIQRGIMLQDVVNGVTTTCNEQRFYRRCPKRNIHLCQLHIKISI